MASFDQVWNDKFLLGIPLIDQHHKILVGLIVDLRNEIEAGHVDRDFALSMVEALKSYAKYHFMAEERFLLECKYLALDLHREEHRYFEAKVEDFRTAMLGSEDLLVKELLSFLKDWLLDHILVKDRDFGDYYRKYREG